MKAVTRRLFEEQLVVVAFLGSGKKSDPMWHVPQQVHPLPVRQPLLLVNTHNSDNLGQGCDTDGTCKSSV